MISRLQPVRAFACSDSIERILSSYYPQLVEWSRILARGDEGAAEETVQDLCLHLTIAQPDLNRVENLDNYLFMCLRNMYVSNLARVSRERLRVIYVEDYDAVEMLVHDGGADVLEVQNELLRICDYARRRKHSSKSASHFILHFFFGYRRNDVALLARVPIAAIYNGLKDMRGELRSYLSEGKQIRMVGQTSGGERELLRTPVTSDVLLRELRSTLLDADFTECIGEKALAEGYRAGNGSPVSSQELAHLAGCERCLRIVERAMKIDDRDGPLDGLEVDFVPKRKESQSFDTTMRMVRRRSAQIIERRPTLLAIAVDGRVVAFHAVESAHNSLSSRVDSAATVRFIEVFDEFGDRLAHLPLQGATDTAPTAGLSQQLLLSDGRRLRLEVRFDGLGLHAEVDYVDPSLVSGAELDELPRLMNDGASLWAGLRVRLASYLRPRFVTAFASLLLVAVAGIAAYKYAHPGVDEVLSRAAAVAQVPSSTEALHQVLRIEELSGTEKASVLGTVDIWRRNDRRVVRRLYNAQQQLLATSVMSAAGDTVHLEKSAQLTSGARQLIESGVWQSDVSTAAFGGAAEASRNSSGVELTRRGEGRGVLERTLVLDRQYGVQYERVRFRTERGVHEVRLVQTLLRNVPTRDVPSSAFAESQEIASQKMQRPRGALQVPDMAVPEDASGANLEVSVLFALFEQDADTGQPLDVRPMPDGRVRVSGTVATAQALGAIREQIAALPDSGRVEFQVHSAAQAANAIHQRKELSEEVEATSDDAPAAGLVSNVLRARGLRGAPLQNAGQEFTASVLMHAQTALQHAYALDRLGSVLRQPGASSLGPAARRQWAVMVERHAAHASSELEALKVQLNSLVPELAGPNSMDSDEIANAADFARAASKLRSQAQSVNAKAIELFAGSATNMSQGQAREEIGRLRSMLPMRQAGSMRIFAVLLRAQIEQGETNAK